jgi:hypothetical protein
MSQTGAEKKVKQALFDTTGLSPEGTSKAQINGGTIYVAVPFDLAEAYGITPGSELPRAHHPESDTLVVSLDGSPIFNTR